MRPKRTALMQKSLEEIAMKRVKRAYKNRGTAPPEEAMSIDPATVIASTLKDIRDVAGAF